MVLQLLEPTQTVHMSTLLRQRINGLLTGHNISEVFRTCVLHVGGRALFGVSIARVVSSIGLQ